MKVLVVNAGSSSLKYQLFDTAKDVVLAKGNCERIGMNGSRIIHKTAGKGEYINESPLANHADATKIGSISAVVKLFMHLSGHLCFGDA